MVDRSTPGQQTARSEIAVQRKREIGPLAVGAAHDRLMHNDHPAHHPSQFVIAAARHLLSYYEEEGDFGALTATESASTEAAVGGLAAALEAAAESFMTFEEGEPPSVFNDLACSVVGLRGALCDGPDADPDPERTALVREAARLEMRLEDLAADIMYAGLERCVATSPVRPPAQPAAGGANGEASGSGPEE